MSEEDIFPTFNAFGPLKDVAIIRDKHSALHRGCAFVTYWSPEDAETAISTLHDQFTFPGGRRPAQVKPAEPTSKQLDISIVFNHEILASTLTWFRFTFCFSARE